jgi:2-amino-4-hydroxy-6-hydroxymethyldihydropteridine diphosphokinase
MESNVFLALGSNLGDREYYIEQALNCIQDLRNTRIREKSNIYETEPVGNKDQARFLNMVVKIETELPPEELLTRLQEIESLLKRTREIHWGPRTIDIDILLYGRLQIELPHLTIPHPRMLERAFVLIPLRDVFTGETLLGQDLSVLIHKCEDKNGVNLFKVYKRYKERG